MAHQQIMYVKEEPADEVQREEEGHAEDSQEVTMNPEMQVDVKDEPVDVEYHAISPKLSEEESEDDWDRGMSSDSSDDMAPPIPGYVWGSKPYMFEPTYSKAELAERKRKKEERARLMPWCSCPNCTVSELEKRQVCCNSGRILQLKNDKSKNYCISMFGELKSCILNKDVLELACHQIMAHQKPEIKQKLMETSNCKMRFLAYRNFALWVNCVVNPGTNFSVDIPSCVISAVRKEFPETSKAYPKFDITLEGDFMLDYPA